MPKTHRHDHERLHADEKRQGKRRRRVWERSRFQDWCVGIRERAFTLANTNHWR
jgi:hypothetical protein